LIKLKDELFGVIMVKGENVEIGITDTLPQAFIRQELPITGTSSSYIPEYEE